MKKIFLITVLIFFVGFVLVLPAGAVESTNATASGNVCDRLETAWSAKQAGYERAREVRRKAFENTKVRWGKLFDKLDAKKVDTTVVRADATDAASKFEALLAADDAQMAALKNYGEAVCAKSGVDEARKALKTAQEGRRSARLSYNKSLRQLATDLAKLRSTKSTVNSTSK